MQYNYEREQAGTNPEMLQLLAQHWPEIQSIARTVSFTPNPDQFSPDITKGEGFSLPDSAVTPGLQAWLDNLNSRKEGMSTEEILRKVNYEVNNNITYQKDTYTYGRSEYAASPAEVLKNGVGDCEDIAGLKAALLQRLGFDESQLIMITGVKPNGERHANLIVKDGDQMYTMDNGSSSITRPPESYMATVDGCFSPNINAVCVTNQSVESSPSR